jgi:short-subunit dehydrogenase involved in D-alanine esterification of teichoic acids
VEDGSHVIVSGRRKENLEELVHRYGRDKVSAVQFDITILNGIPAFASTVTTMHPDLDCVFLNSGIQRGFNFAKPETVNMDVVSEEFTTNYLSYLALTTAFLPFLQAKNTESSLIYTSSALALIPSPICPNYCASKAALHHFILCLRRQLQGSQIKVVEILPPAVQTELHDEKHQPDIKNGRLIGMPLDEFTDEAYRGLIEGLDQIPVGMAKKIFDAFETKRQEIFNSF